MQENRDIENDGTTGTEASAGGAEAPDATGGAEAQGVQAPPEGDAPPPPAPPEAETGQPPADDAPATDEADEAEAAPDETAPTPDETVPAQQTPPDAEAPLAPETTPAPDEAETMPDKATPDPEIWSPGATAEAASDGPDAQPIPEPEPAPDPAPIAAEDIDEDLPAPPCAAGIFGKLPARGDFISRAITQDLLRPFEDWLLPLVQNTRALLGEDWSRAWRQAPPWRFWIGPDILRGEWTRNLRAHERAGTVTGVLLPSTDRQGRLFPLVLVLADDHARLMPPPVLEPPDRRWFAACDRLLLSARDGAALEAVEADLAALRAPRLPDDAAQMAQLLVQRSLWGQGAGQAGPQDEGDVWSGIRASDHHLAATGRSYWWCEAASGATSVISLAGLPDAETFAFMLTDAVPADPPQTGA